MKSLRVPLRPESRRTGNVFIIASMLLSLGILTFIKGRYCPAPYVKTHKSQELEAPLGVVKTVTEKSEDPAPLEDEVAERNGASTQQQREAATTAAKPAIDPSKPLCSQTSKRSEVCEAQGDIRIKASSRTILLHPSLTQQEWVMKPYARKHDAEAMKKVEPWTLKPFPGDQPPPACTHNHTVPALVFSVGGFTGNLFHDFTDVIVPLFVTAHQFHGEVQFVIADMRSWWVNKFSLIFGQFSKYEIIDASSDQDAVRCFPRVVAGLDFHKELGVKPSRTPTNYSMMDFKAELQKAFGLERTVAEPSGEDWDIRRKPRLLIISRRKTRAFLNERNMADMAMSLGFDVRIAEPETTTDLAKFARLVNSADVMLGVHGAGLANMVFLPAGAVLIQVVPMGGLGWLARDTFEKPSPDMKIRYLDYHIQADESTLSEQYPMDHPVIKDPNSIHKQGWNVISKTYLENQNVRPHLPRLRKTLLEALKFLPHGRNNAAPAAAA